MFSQKSSFQTSPVTPDIDKESHFWNRFHLTSLHWVIVSMNYITISSLTT